MPTCDIPKFDQLPGAKGTVDPPLLHYGWAMAKESLFQYAAARGLD